MEEEFTQVIEPDDVLRQEAPEAPQEAPGPSEAEKLVFYSPVAQYSFAATLRQMQASGVSARGKLAWLLRDAMLCDPRIPDLTRAHTSPDTYEGDRVLVESRRVAVVVNGDDLVYYTKFGRGLALAELAFFGDVPYDSVSDCVREAVSRDDVMDARLKYSRSGSWFDIQKSIGEKPSHSAMDAAAHRADRSLSDLVARSEGLLPRISDRVCRRLDDFLGSDRSRTPVIEPDRGLSLDERQAVEEQWAKDHPEEAGKPYQQTNFSAWLHDATDAEIEREIRSRMESDPLFRQVYEEFMAVRAELAKRKAGPVRNLFEAAERKLKAYRDAREEKKEKKRQSSQPKRKAQKSPNRKLRR